MEHKFVAVGKQSREGRQTVFFSPLNPLGQDDEEESIHNDMTIPRKFHHCSKWRHDQDGVYWVKMERHKIWYYNFGKRSLMLSLFSIQYHQNPFLRLLPNVISKQFTIDRFHLNLHPRSSFEAIGKCSSQPKVAPGNHEQDWDATRSRKESLQEGDRVESTTSIFNKIDLRIDGIPQKSILQDGKQMKDISDVLQKLEQGKVDLGENSNREDSEEIAKNIQDQGKVELVELRQTTKTIQCQAGWKHIPEGMVKCYCGTIIRLSQPMERFKNCVNRNSEELLLQEDWNLVLILW